MVTELWTLPELAGLVASALASGYDGQPSRRISAVPDIRAIRYYTTLGLLDRPAAMRGRTALYGQRHLWQLVAIKRLQAAGNSLAAIQQSLTAAPDTTLRRLADLPSEPFWRRAPADMAPADAQPARETLPPAGPAPRPDRPTTQDSIVFQAVTLAGGAVVLIPHRHTLSDRDIADLRAAAAPLASAVNRLSKGRP